MTRAGVGFDAHPFADGRTLVIGGVLMDHPRGLEGHSDGDVLSHAIADAILGAAGLGDIGTHFPSTDERWRDASSTRFLAHVAAMVRDAGYGVGNVDGTVICEEPPIAPFREKMALSIAESLGVDASNVNVKATTSDGMGFTGRREGIAAIAVAVLESL